MKKVRRSNDVGTALWIRTDVKSTRIGLKTDEKGTIP
jgi:hypothetical protein